MQQITLASNDNGAICKASRFRMFACSPFFACSTEAS